MFISVLKVRLVIICLLVITLERRKKQTSKEFLWRIIILLFDFNKI